MAINIETEDVAVCENEQCPDYKSFELYSLDDEIKKDEKGYYVICRGCGLKIYLD